MNAKTIFAMAKANNRGQITVGSVMTIFITVLVAVALFPSIQQSIGDANASGTEATVLNLVTLLYTLLVLSIVAVELVVAFRKAQ